VEPKSFYGLRSVPGAAFAHLVAANPTGVSAIVASFEYKPPRYFAFLTNAFSQSAVDGAMISSLADGLSNGGRDALLTLAHHHVSRDVDTMQGKHQTAQLTAMSATGRVTLGLPETCHCYLSLLLLQRLSTPVLAVVPLAVA
jgi:hypothetical protein